MLASSFVGGPRDMQRRYQDAMAVVRQRGKPSFFITFTCNPGWPEIQTSLPSGLAATDRPDIVARVFNQKLRPLLQDLKTGMIFGEAVAHLSVVEFQKRGLPHAHILIILKASDRINSADDIDDTVIAELPPLPTGPCPPSTDTDARRKYDQAKRLHELVCEHMVHNDCSSRRDAPCLNEEGFCSKGYRKEFSEETRWSELEIYPEYRRRRPSPGAPPIMHKGRELDNRWVVPYSPYLLLKYEAHIKTSKCAFRWRVSSICTSAVCLCSPSALPMSKLDLNYAC